MCIRLISKCSYLLSHLAGLILIYFKANLYKSILVCAYTYTHLSTLNWKILRTFLVKESYFTIRNKSAGTLNWTPVTILLQHSGHHRSGLLNLVFLSVLFFTWEAQNQKPWPPKWKCCLLWTMTRENRDVCGILIQFPHLKLFSTALQICSLQMPKALSCISSFFHLAPKCRGNLEYN